MNRKHLILSLSCTSLLILANSCDSSKKSAEAFAEKFAGYAGKEMLDSIYAVYPAAELADKIDVDFKADSLSVEKADKDGEYTITYNSGEQMVVSVGKDGNVSVVESKGLFKYSPAKMTFAEKVGALKKGLNDEDLAKRMIQVDNLSTGLFNEFVKSRKNAVKNLGFTVTYEPSFAMETGTGYYTLKNTTDQPIGGDEYEITYVGNTMYAGVDKSWTDIEPGKDIPPHGTVMLQEEFNWHGGRELKAITMHIPTKESFFKNYQPTGDEYNDYVKVHGDKVVKKSTLGYGPFQFAGKLGGKYPIHINIEKGMKYGSYYYDKNGPKATLDLQVKAYNENTGELTMEETNNKGEVTGTFIGVVTPYDYSGKMTSFQGKTYDFTLDVVN
ncbi:MAG: hypothetical protein K2N25_00910 [Muribaculaceae bacterium]|nr:hypothetical protein [Muribaculaceae bacterium]